MSILKDDDLSLKIVELWYNTKEEVEEPNYLFVHER
jgi:hypothetical protein